LDDEMGAVIGAGMETNKAFLMGRKLYDEWVAHWPDSTDEPFATYFNTVPKYVISSSLEKPTWNNTTALAGDTRPRTGSSSSTALCCRPACST
jgi:dihydrofolate reductase